MNLPACLIIHTGGRSVFSENAAFISNESLIFLVEPQYLASLVSFKRDAKYCVSMVNVFLTLVSTYQSLPTFWL
jgi:hypothetical protein